MAEKRTYKKRNNLVKRGNVWYVRIFVDGKDTWRAAGRDRHAAQEYLGKLRGDVERGQLRLSKSARGVPTLSGFKDQYMKWAKAHKRSWERDERSLRELEPVFGDTKLISINKAKVEKYQHKRLADGVQGATVNREVALLRKMLSYAVDCNVIEVNPLSRVRMLPESPGRIPILEPDDERKLLAHGPTWFRLLVRMAVATGCRQGELLALRWRHLDLADGVLTVEDSKSGDSRRVPIHPALLADLEARKASPDDYVFQTRDKTPPARSSVANAFRDAAAAIGRTDLRFHDMRHVAGTRLLATGASLPEVAAMLGHKTLAMSKRYSHVSPVRLRALIAEMPVAEEPPPRPAHKGAGPAVSETGKVIKFRRPA